jgi:hypothetical protein
MSEVPLYLLRYADLSPAPHARTESTLGVGGVSGHNLSDHQPSELQQIRPGMWAVSRLAKSNSPLSASKSEIQNRRCGPKLRGHSLSKAPPALKEGSERLVKFCWCVPQVAGFERTLAVFRRIRQCSLRTKTRVHGSGFITNPFWCQSRAGPEFAR